MTDSSDMELVENYRQGSEEAFAVLVRRHVDLVFSAAFRHVRNNTHAEEITQAVFILLARKAVNLRSDTLLEAWLYQTARLTSLSFLRHERRRQFHEHEAFMQSSQQEDSDTSAWNQLAPLLDEAMERLAKKDRDAVILRFFKGKNLREVAAALNMSEAVAQKRVYRAMEKMRLFFSKRGVALTSVAITGAICTNSVQAAPAALANTVTVAAISKGTAASGSTLTLIKGALKIMAWAKAKVTVTASAAVLLAAGTTAVLVEKADSSALDESYWEMSGKNLARSSVVIIRPTRFPGEDTGTISGDGRFIAHNWSFLGILSAAFSSSSPRMVLPADMPQGRFDLINTLPSGQEKALRKEIQRKFGYVGRRQNIETNVLFLRVKDASRLEAHRGKGKWDYVISNGYIINSNYPISRLLRDIEWEFKIPIILESGCIGNFDFRRKMSSANSSNKGEERRQFARECLDEIGLELVPGRATLEMVLIEKSTAKDTFLEPLPEKDYERRAGSLLQGHWEGDATIKNERYHLKLKIAQKSENTFRAETEVSELNKTMQATSVTFNPPALIVQFGEFPWATFEGKLAGDGKTINGMVTASGQAQPMTLRLMDNP